MSASMLLQAARLVREQNQAPRRDSRSSFSDLTGIRRVSIDSRFVDAFGMNAKQLGCASGCPASQANIGRDGRWREFPRGRSAARRAGMAFSLSSSSEAPSEHAVRAGTGAAELAGMEAATMMGASVVTPWWGTDSLIRTGDGSDTCQDTGPRIGQPAFQCVPAATVGAGDALVPSPFAGVLRGLAQTAAEDCPEYCSRYTTSLRDYRDCLWECLEGAEDFPESESGSGDGTRGCTTGDGNSGGGSAGSETFSSGWAGWAWTSGEFTWLINKAFAQIANNLDLVTAYFDESGVSGNGGCIVGRFSANPPTIFVVDQDVQGWTIPCLGYIWLKRDYLQAIWNTYDVSSCGDDDGECACAITALSDTLIHELHHTCCGDEKKAALVAYYYRVKFAERHGYTDCNCCVTPGEVSWDPEFYGDEADVESRISRVQTGRDSSGTLRITGCT